MVNSRQLALNVLLEWERGQVYAQDLIERAATQNRLEHRDTALLQSMVYSVLRNINLLDCWLDEVCDNKHLQNSVHWLMRLGVAQLLLLDMPAHAAVNETVSLAGKARGLMNAVLRRADREKAALLDWARQLPPTDRFSHPEWLIQRWEKQLGSEFATKLCEWNQQPATSFIRVNHLHPQPLTAEEISPLEATANPGFFHAPQPPREWLSQGRCYTQDLSTALACELLSPQAGELVLDACAAPGGKTAYLAQLMGNAGQIIACDSHPLRVERLKGNLERLHVANTETRIHDWLKSPLTAWNGMQFDRILVDAPCSNTGVMRRRIDVRWRLMPSSFAEMVSLQRDIMENVLPLLKPGGSIVYSTCSLDREENAALIEQLLQQHPELSLVETRTALPWRDDCDGAFASLLMRAV